MNLKQHLVYSGYGGLTHTYLAYMDSTLTIWKKEDENSLLFLFCIFVVIFLRENKWGRGSEGERDS